MLNGYHQPFAIKVFRWIRELFTTGTANYNIQKSNDELIQLRIDLQKLQEESWSKNIKACFKRGSITNSKKLENNHEFLCEINELEFVGQPAILQD